MTNNEAPNVIRPGGGRVHRATTSGMPYCQPNGRVTARGVMGLVRTARPVDCQRCAKIGTIERVA